MNIHRALKWLSNPKNKEVADDGTREWAEQAQAALEEERQFEDLLRHKGFQVIMKELETKFIERVSRLVEQDDQLRTIKSIYDRVLSASGTHKRVEQHLKDYLGDVAFTEISEE